MTFRTLLSAIMLLTVGFYILDIAAFVFAVKLGAGKCVSECKVLHCAGLVKKKKQPKKP